LLKGRRREKINAEDAESADGSEKRESGWSGLDALRQGLVYRRGWTMGRGQK